VFLWLGFLLILGSVMVKFWGCAGSGCRGLSDLVRKGGLGLRVSQELLQVSL
jgi:hypothetical protein